MNPGPAPHASMAGTPVLGIRHVTKEPIASSKNSYEAVWEAGMSNLVSISAPGYSIAEGNKGAR